MCETLEFLNAPDDVIQRVRGAGSTEPEIQPCNAYIVSLFYRVSTQWEYAGMSGVRVAMNYPGIEARAKAMPGFNNLSDELKDKVWQGLQTIERTVLSCQKDD